MNNVQDDCWSMVLACDITFLRCGLQALEAEKDQQESGNSFPPQLCSRAAGLLKCQQLLSAKLQTILIPTCALKKCFYFILKNCYISSVSPLGYDRRLRLGGDSILVGLVLVKLQGNLHRWESSSRRPSTWLQRKPCPTLILCPS